MNKSELKKILKPLIKECIKEVIFEKGTLSTIISEVINGTTPRDIVTESENSIRPRQVQNKNPELANKRLLENKKKMLDAIGRDAYNGVDLFEGTSPTKADRTGTVNPQGSGALDGVDPRDAGVDISSFGMGSVIWKKLAGN